MQDFRKDLEEIVARVREYHPDFSKRKESVIRRAFTVSQAAHSEQMRFSGEPYFTHPVAATKILLSIQPDEDTIIACLLHDVIEDTAVTADEIEEIFGENIRFLCEGVEKVSKVQLKASHPDQKKFENFQKLFIAISKDIRVVFIKLADRIHNLQTLEHVRPEKQQRIAYESMEVYAPVAEKLGLFEFKNEIENLSFRAMESKKFTELSLEVEECKKERRKFIEQARSEVETVFQKEKFSVHVLDISGREKTIYSIYEKMRRKSYQRVSEVFDLFGLRIIVRSVEDCYRTLGIVHSHWHPIPGRFKDYISVPKPNGYQSLHTTVLGLSRSKLPTEVQIRTEQMNLDAEYGPAAHWAYKKAKNSNFDEAYLQRTQWFPQHIQFSKDSAPADFFRQISETIFAEQIYIFTPKGEIKILPKNSTPVDFAYAVHTDVGNSCVGAVVNGVIKPLDYQIRNGDVVKILTKSGRKPNSEWLKFVKSSGAKEKIRHVLRQLGVIEFPEIIQKKKISPSDLEKISVAPSLKTKRGSKKKEYSLIIGGADGLSYRLAPCCQAVLGKNLLAYKSRGLSFTVHDAECSELERLEPERFYEAHFSRQVRVKIHAFRRVGLLRDYTTVIAHNGVDIYDTQLLPATTMKECEWFFLLAINSEKELAELLRDLQKVESVQSAKVC
ncbi:bifunctional (p)ppGpp synthetase/guanosine-3',5'-bis(diphosphate) 3'-pyrophosphohydrolase [bacterium]|jgi:GTP diphosphokinase / guanosine-3',5'-bis(diphosphate) 3'-diphosphatase|nr:bifunctional (p)ppGpp synthetase/guanosine-3',5'-bis(diphosphate) 3'-pyrophosphohydrolase [bacterium]MBT6831955.1 bifunctional (p)ppGpp synthetase/guanosine-3',5'-bis(diphosphate) 3'-pyrophosphohydrolase [bacterium]MBT6996651.1 bifunctional (p)ppGpp synthetase/guanosine-3',5'-bis(diphosphate) 3'-pyrophosphohydrolase [bacterium]MBT7773071.1 bifunctional (p)ppGpp synthetase/guanosine-3',5'-bis(diphosphate) 3'-pyrophosphohydrolase [bacterium]